LTLQNGILVLKQDGIFRISTGNPYQIQLLDSTARIIAPNTAVVGNNKVWYLSDQGVVAASETDVKVMSAILDNVIIKTSSGNLFPNLAETAWAIAYQADRKYELWLPTTGIETQATQQYIYNYVYEQWTRWTFKGTSAMIFNVNGKMYYGSEVDSAPVATESYIYEERKSFTPQDYVDDEYESICNTTGNLDTIVVDNFLLPNATVILPGWTVTQTSTGSLARVVSYIIGATTTTFVLDKKQNWLPGAINIWQPVYSEAQTIQIDCDNPGFNKQFSEIVYVFSEQSFTKITAAMSSDTTTTKVLDYLIPLQTGGWGVGPWGAVPWGGTLPLEGKIRRYVAREVQRAGWIILNLTNAEAFTGFGFAGFEMYWKVTSTRQF
jgi:hypothetical protein